MSRAGSRIWLGFSRFQVPTAIVKEGVLLGGIEATVLLVLYKLANVPVSPAAKDPVVEVRVKIPRLIVLMGLADKSVRRALKSLAANGFIATSHHRKKNGSLIGGNTYLLLHPETGVPLKAEVGYAVCFLKDIPYFPVPTIIVKEGHLARLTLSQQSLYIAFLIIAGRGQSLTFTATPAMLKKLSHLSVKTFNKAMEGLILRGLINCNGKMFTLLDPLTGARTQRFAKEEDNPRN
jgi:hypothetical protein